MIRINLLAGQEPQRPDKAPSPAPCLSFPWE